MFDVNQYRADGYTALRGVFRPAWGEKYMAEKYAIWKAMSRDEYRSAARTFGCGVSQTILFGASKLLGAIQQLGVKDPLFLTQPAVHCMGVDDEWSGVGAHQDWPALQSSLNAVVCWMPFTKVGLENYPLEIAPGSHKLGLLPAKAGTHYSEVDTEGMTFVPVPCEVGDVILFSTFTVHRTRTPGQGFRLAMSHRFEDAADPWYAQHGYCAQSRTIDRELKYAPSIETVQAALA